MKFNKAKILGVVAAILTGLFTIVATNQEKNNPNEHEAVNEPPKIEIVVGPISTNSLDRAGKNQTPQKNVNWFQESSQYLWDGWKIK